MFRTHSVISILRSLPISILIIFYVPLQYISIIVVPLASFTHHFQYFICYPRFPIPLSHSYYGTFYCLCDCHLYKCPLLIYVWRFVISFAISPPPQPSLGNCILIHFHYDRRCSIWFFVGVLFFPRAFGLSLNQIVITFSIYHMLDGGFVSFHYKKIVITFSICQMMHSGFFSFGVNIEFSQNIFKMASFKLSCVCLCPSYSRRYVVSSVSNNHQH